MISDSPLLYYPTSRKDIIESGHAYSYCGGAPKIVRGEEEEKEDDDDGYCILIRVDQDKKILYCTVETWRWTVVVVLY